MPVFPPPLFLTGLWRPAKTGRRRSLSTRNTRRNSAFDGDPRPRNSRGKLVAGAAHLVFEREPTDVVLFVDGEFQEYFADVRGAGLHQSFHRGGVQHGAVVRPKHFDVAMVVQPVDCQRFVKKRKLAWAAARPGDDRCYVARQKTPYHLRVREGDDAQREVRNRDERGGRVDERYEIVERLEIHDRRRDLHLRRVIHVQSEAIKKRFLVPRSSIA